MIITSGKRLTHRDDLHTLSKLCQARDIERGTDTMTSTTSRRATSSTQLSQIVAIAGGVKTRTEQALTRVYHQIQKPAPFTGITRTYRPRDEQGEELPPESTLVQVRVDDLINEVSAAMSRMLDVVATQDWANTQARADIIVDGIVLLDNVPVTYLMWLEKQIIQMRTFVGRLPVLDVSEEWRFDEDAKAWATEASEVTKTRKTPCNHIVAPATDKHPQQTQVYYDDLVIGYWRTIRYSGAVPARRVFDLAARVETLLDAVRFAREQANMTPVTDVEVGETIMRYLFR
jgi:hypothetical protein